MSEEESIKWLEELLKDKEKYKKYHSWVGTDTFVAIDIILDLYNKQKEKIKELKLITNGYESYLGENMSGCKIIIADSEYFLNGTFVEKYISKDKITEKIKKLERVKEEYLKRHQFIDLDRILYKIEVLKELLEEK